MMGRTVPLEIILNTHLRAPEAILKIANFYKHDPRVAVAIIDNSDRAGNAAITDLEFVERVARRYSRESLRAALLRALEDAYEKGKKGDKDGISESIYREIKGRVP
jgi:hypothetical protein